MGALTDEEEDPIVLSSTWTNAPPSPDPSPSLSPDPSSPFSAALDEKSKRRRVHRVIARECSDDSGGAQSERGNRAPSPHSCDQGSIKTWPRTTTWRPSVSVGLRNQATRSGQWPPPAPCSPRFLLHLAVDVPTRSARVMVHLRWILSTLQIHKWKCSVFSVQQDKSTMFFSSSYIQRRVRGWVDATRARLSGSVCDGCESASLKHTRVCTRTAPHGIRTLPEPRRKWSVRRSSAHRHRYRHVQDVAEHPVEGRVALLWAREA